ncbi:hypothetical protein N0V88_006308 [Collariella sp. IMI 366227]|nr:hypothetical protein N0V88_006308 [Collariella sp. IMI 366227]
MEVAINLSLPLLTFASAVFVGLRLFCKDMSRPPPSGDDWAMGVAWVFLFISVILGMWATSKGYGQHLAELKAGPREAVHFLAASEAFSVASIALSKISFGWTLLKTLKRTAQGRFLVWLISGLLISVTSVTLGSATFLWIVIWKGDSGVIAIAKITQMRCSVIEKDITCSHT